MTTEEHDLVEADELELLSFAGDEDEISDEELWDRLEAVPSLKAA